MQYFGFDRPSFGIKTFGFGDNFDPMTLFADNQQGVWYDPSDKSTLFQDAAGTMPVTKSGDPVGLMLDKSGNNNHATQTVSGSRPTYTTKEYAGLYFDGVDDHLNFTYNNSSNLTHTSIIANSEKENAFTLLGRELSRGSRILLLFNKDPVFYPSSSGVWSANANGVEITSANNARGNAGLVSAVYNKDGFLSVLHGDLPLSSVSIKIGTMLVGYIFRGYIGEIIMCDDLSITDLNLLNIYLGKKSGVVL